MSTHAHVGSPLFQGQDPIILVELDPKTTTMLGVRRSVYCCDLYSIDESHLFIFEDDAKRSLLDVVLAGLSLSEGAGNDYLMSWVTENGNTALKIDFNHGHVRPLSKPVTFRITVLERLPPVKGS